MKSTKFTIQTAPDIIQKIILNDGHCRFWGIRNYSYYSFKPSLTSATKKLPEISFTDSKESEVFSGI